MTDEVAGALPAYEVDDEIGRGAYGRVLAGRHRRLNRRVAIKQLDAALARDDTYRAAFLREAQVMAELSHPHVVHVYDFVEDGDLLLLVMEHLDRGSLADAHELGEVDARTACGAVMAACAGVQFVHERGVLHRDLKPENLMLDSQGTLKVTDFGLARADGDVRRTQRGDLLGSPAFMAPEQAAGGDVGPPADVYTLGASLYYLLLGSFPHDTEGGTMAVLQRRLTQPARPLADAAPDVPPFLAEVVMTSLAVDPENRPASAEALGVAVGAAAADAWGAGWIDRSSVQVRAPGRVLTAAQPTAHASSPTDAASSGDDPVTATVDTRAARTVPPAPVELAPVELAPVEAGSSRSRRGVVLGVVAALVALVAVVAAFVATRGSDDDGGGEVAAPAARTVDPAWTFATGGEVFASPTASGANVVVGSVDGNVYAIDATDGHEVWRASTDGPVRSSVAVDGGRAYVGSFDGNLYAFDVASGQELWRQRTNYEIVSSPVVADGLVIVGAADLLAFDAATGEPRWTLDTDQPVVSSPAVAGTSVYVGSNDGYVYAAGLDDGLQRWQLYTNGAVQSSPVVVDGVVYVGSNDGTVYAIDAEGGTELWTHYLRSDVRSSPAVADGVVYVGTADGALVALSASDGTERWRTTFAASVDSSPLVHGGEAVVGSNDRRLHGVDAATGTPVWEMATGDVVLSSPAVVGTTFVVGSRDGKVYGVRP